MRMEGSIVPATAATSVWPSAICGAAGRMGRAARSAPPANVKARVPGALAASRTVASLDMWISLRSIRTRERHSQDTADGYVLL